MCFLCVLLIFHYTQNQPSALLEDEEPRSPTFINHLPGSRSKRIEVFSKDGWLGSALRWRFQSVALERKVLFVHAGLLPNFSQVRWRAPGFRGALGATH